jgi:transcriptional regulator with XRE-family HTH domain
MAKRKRAYSRIARQAAELLGLQIRQARVERRWSVRELAERAGISTDTLLRVERGDPTVSLGIAFDVATLVGVPLFHEDRPRLAREVARGRDRVALLPQRVRRPETPVDDDF